MIWVSGCIIVAGLVLGQTEGRNYDVLLCPVKKCLCLTLAVYVYFDLWVQTDPISKQSTMPDSFLKQWSSTSKQIWFQAAVDARATTWTGPSPAPEMVDLFQRTSVPFCALMWCTHLPSWEGTIWWPLSGMTRVQTGPRACKSSSETAAVVVAFPSWTLRGSSGILYTVVCGHAFHRVRGLRVWNHAIYCCCCCCCWCSCPLTNAYCSVRKLCLSIFYIYLALGHTHRLRRIVTISVRWMLLCKEVIIAEDSPYITMQHMPF